jgi:hypothetical protein
MANQTSRTSAASPRTSEQLKADLKKVDFLIREHAIDPMKWIEKTFTDLDVLFSRIETPPADRVPAVVLHEIASLARLGRCVVGEAASFVGGDIHEWESGALSQILAAVQGGEQ